MLASLLRRGIIGGMFLYHHFRYHGRDETFVGERAHYYVGGHFHILGAIKSGYGNCRHCGNVWLDKKGCAHVIDSAKCMAGCNGFEAVTRRAYETDGCIVKVEGERKTLGGTVWYELSHVSIRKDAKKQVVVNWFGAYGRNKLRIPKGSMPQHEHLCKICGEPHYPIKCVCGEDIKIVLAVMANCKESESMLFDMYDENGKARFEVDLDFKRQRGNG